MQILIGQLSFKKTEHSLFYSSIYYCPLYELEALKVQKV